MNRVWCFIISKPLSASDLEELLNKGKKFTSEWTAHENKLSAEIKVLFDRILFITVNETISAASGCSIDKLTRFIKETEKQFNIELLNRLLVAYKKNEKVEVVHSSKIKELLQTGIINENTIVLNTSIANQNEFTNWELPLKSSWLNRYLIQ
jgi:hypothetical protein